MQAFPFSGAAPGPIPTASYAIGGTTSGLSGLVLQNNAGDDLPVAADGTFHFAGSMSSGATYLARVKTAPTNPARSTVPAPPHHSNIPTTSRCVPTAISTWQMVGPRRTSTS